MNKSVCTSLKVVNMNQVSFSPRREFLEDSVQRLSVIYDILLNGGNEESLENILLEILQYAVAYASAEKLVPQ